jgi:hypothetical protein
MFYNDHNPPHFHVEYGEYKAVINFQHEIVKGTLPKRALKLIFEWMDLHKAELEDNWACALEGKPLNKIAPLN